MSLSTWLADMPHSRNKEHAYDKKQHNTKHTNDQILHHLDAGDQTERSKDAKCANDLHLSKAPGRDDDDQVKDQPAVQNESPPVKQELHGQFHGKNDQKDLVHEFKGAQGLRIVLNERVRADAHHDGVNGNERNDEELHLVVINDLAAPVAQHLVPIQQVAKGRLGSVVAIVQRRHAFRHLRMMAHVHQRVVVAVVVVVVVAAILLLTLIGLLTLMHKRRRRVWSLLLVAVDVVVNVTMASATAAIVVIHMLHAFG